MEINNTIIYNAGKVTITGAGNAVITINAAETATYTAASKKVNVKVNPASIESAIATLNTLYWKCTGGQRKPLPKVVLDGETLVRDNDYTLSWGSNTYPGYGYIYITGINDYDGKITKTFYILRVSGLEVLSHSTNSLQLTWTKQSNVTGYKIYQYDLGEYTYIGAIKGEDNNLCIIEELSPGKGYSFKVKAYKKVGSKTYNGVSSKYISAPTRPTKAALTKLTTGSTHYVKAYWNQKSCTGYQVRIARNSGFTSYDKTYNVKSYKTTSFKVSNLTKGKTYYVKIRAYKTYGGKTVYGNWSYYKKITCR